jgi:hypothetical protein
VRRARRTSITSRLRLFQTLPCALLALTGCSRASEGAASSSAALRAEPTAAPRELTPAPKMPQPNGNSGVAVVELFTSEGCSSCPPADAVLARVSEQAERAGQSVFALELHVDYWDYLGWRDPFDDARFSARQAGYRALSGSTYTPQAVVNGERECVGSNRARLDALIQRALAEPATTALELAASFDGAGVRVRYVSDSQEPAQRLNLFVLERASTSRVTRGENAGAELAHHDVARAFDERALAAGHVEGSWHAALPVEFSRAGARVLAFAQRAPQGRITGARVATLGP